MFVAISCFEVQNGFEDQVKQAFKDRPKLVENYEGFVRLEVLSPAKNPAEIWLITHWKDEAGFKDWHKNHLKESHQGIPWLGYLLHGGQYARYQYYQCSKRAAGRYFGYFNQHVV